MTLLGLFGCLPCKYHKIVQVGPQRILYHCQLPLPLSQDLQGLRRRLAVLFFPVRIIEPVHEISNNVVCGTSKGSDQPAVAMGVTLGTPNFLSLKRT